MAASGRLSDAEIAAGLERLDGWELVAGKLHRDLRFRDFGEAFAFMLRVAMIAEKRDHHPEWSNVYDRVAIDLVSHDAGGISQRDLDLAAAIDELV